MRKRNWIKWDFAQKVVCRKRGREEKMNKKKIMEEILEENRQMNQNLLHLSNVGGMLILIEGMREAMKKRDKAMLSLLKLGFVLVMLTELILTALHVSSLVEKIKLRRADAEEEEE